MNQIRILGFSFFIVIAGGTVQAETLVGEYSTADYDCPSELVQAALAVGVRPDHAFIERTKDGALSIRFQSETNGPSATIDENDERVGFVTKAIILSETQTVRISGEIEIKVNEAEPELPLSPHLEMVYTFVTMAGKMKEVTECRATFIPGLRW